jgi:hypothetical protein
MGGAHFMKEQGNKSMPQWDRTSMRTSQTQFDNGQEKLKDHCRVPLWCMVFVVVSYLAIEQSTIGNPK